MKAILFLSYDGLTDPLGQSQILPYVEELSKIGYKYSILSFEKPDFYEKFKLQISSRCLEAGIKWIPLTYSKRPPVLSTLWDIFKGYIKAREICLSEGVSIVHCRGYITSFLGVRLKRRLATKFVFDMRGFWADEKLESGQWNNLAFRFVYGYFKRAERMFFSYADHVVSLTEIGKRHIVDSFGVADEKISVIPTCINLDRFPERNDERRLEKRRSMGISADAQILIYSGSLGGNYPLNMLASYAKEFWRIYLNGYLLVVTSQLDLVEEMIERFGLPAKQVKAVTSMPDEIYGWLEVADFGLIFYKSGFSNIARFPTKMAEYMAMGLYTLCSGGVGDVELILKGSNSGITIEGTLESLENVRFDKLKARKYSIDNFSVKIGVGRYSEIIEKIGT